MTIETRNPATGERVRSFEQITDHELDSRLQRASDSFNSYRLSSFAERARSLQHAASLLEATQDTLADMMVQEMGKIRGEALSEVRKCATVCRFYAEHAVDFLSDRQIDTDAAQSFVRPFPLGPVLAVMPWNFPLWQVFRFAAPNLMAGNTALLKHASNVPQCALAIEQIFTKAGFQGGAFQTLLIESARVKGVIDDVRIAAVTATGSEGAGRKIASIAGAALKKCVLELGGSDAFIIMPSADLDHAIETAVTARIINNGQSCIAAKRFIVHTDVYDHVRDRMAERFEALTVGEPMDNDTDVGPLALDDIRAELTDQVEATIQAGARRVVGAQAIDGRGYYFTPGILENIPASAPAFSEELFGPVALMFRCSSIVDAIALTNASRFGLGSSIFTQDADELNLAVRDIEAGATFVNQQVASDPRLPFGGVKASGYGRELSREGILEFCNLKTVSKL